MEHCDLSLGCNLACRERNQNGNPDPPETDRIKIEQVRRSETDGQSSLVGSGIRRDTAGPVRLDLGQDSGPTARALTRCYLGVCDGLDATGPEPFR